MFRKLSFAAAIMGALALPSVVLAAPMSGGDEGGMQNGAGMRGNEGGLRGGADMRDHVGGDFRGRGGHGGRWEGRSVNPGGHGGGRGHYWHGRWWNYGVGPCWRQAPDGWIWTCD